MTISPPGGSRTDSHYQRLFEQETIVRTHVEAIVRDLFRKMWIELKIDAENVDRVQNRCRVLIFFVENY